MREPCRAFAPIYQKAARDFGGKLIFAKLDTEAEPLAGEAHQIRSIPTLAVFSGGVEVERQSGAVPPAALAAYLQRWAK